MGAICNWQAKKRSQSYPKLDWVVLLTYLVGKLQTAHLLILSYFHGMRPFNGGK